MGTSRKLPSANWEQPAGDFTVKSLSGEYFMSENLGLGITGAIDDITHGSDCVTVSETQFGSIFRLMKRKINKIKNLKDFKA